MGAFGVAMGFAAFILIREEGKTPAVFLTGLLAAALTSYVIEAVRERAEGAQHGQRPEPGRVLGLLVLLGIFEIFVSGVEKSVALVSAGEAAAFLDQVFVNGITREIGAVVQLLLFAGLWVVLGGAAAWSVMSEAPASLLRRVGLGLATVAGIALVYVLATRLAVTIWVLLTRPQEYQPAFSTLLDPTPSGAGEVMMQLPIMLAAALEQLAGSGRWGGLLLLAAAAVLVALARPVLAGADRGMGHRILAITLLGALVLLALGPFATSGEQLGRLVRIVGASTLIWLVPLTVLSVARPQLGRSARSPRLWGVVSFVVALLLLALTWDRLSEPPVPLYVATLVLALVVTSWLFLRGADVVRFWPLVALTLAIAAFEGSSLLQRLTFLTTFKEAALLQAAPLRGGDERRAARGYDAVDEWRKDSLVSDGTVSLLRAVRAVASDPSSTALDRVEGPAVRALDSAFASAVGALCQPSGTAVLDAIHAEVQESCAQVREFTASARRDTAAAARWSVVWDTLWRRVRNSPSSAAIDLALQQGGEALQFEWYRLQWEDPSALDMREAVARARRRLPAELHGADPATLVERALRDPALADTSRGWALLHAFAVSPPPGDVVRGWTQSLQSLPRAADGRVAGVPISMTITWGIERHRRLADLFEARHQESIPAPAPSPMLRLGTPSRARQQVHTLIALRFAVGQLQSLRGRLSADTAYAADTGAMVALELSLGASFAFWATAGLLAGLAAAGGANGASRASPETSGGAEERPPAPPATTP